MLQELTSFNAHGFRHGQNKGIALGSAYKSQRQTGITAGRLHNGRLRIYQTAGFGGCDHGRADTTFDTRQWIEKLEFGQNFGLQSGPPETVAELSARWTPPQVMVDAEVAAYTGSWAQQMAARTAESLQMHTVALFAWAIWRAGGLMLIGMALYKWGVLTGKRDTRFYKRLALIGLGFGLPVVITGAILNMNSGFANEFANFGPGYLFNYWASILVSLGYIGLITYGVQANWLPGLQKHLAAVGRTALSNYFLQTLLATFIFYGFGLSLFGSVERWGQILIVFSIWALQLAISPWWLQHFRFGPLEWLWRSLTYMSWQPMRVQKPQQVYSV